LLAVTCVVLSIVCVPAGAAKPIESVTEGEGSVAQRLVALSLKQEVSESDARVAATKAQLKAAAQATGETEQAVAAACTRAARFLFDATKAPATSLDVLDGLLAQKSRAPMSDAIGRYVEARRNASGKTHAEALAALKR
jgi:hypothetical protein